MPPKVLTTVKGEVQKLNFFSVFLFTRKEAILYTSTLTPRLNYNLFPEETWGKFLNCLSSQYNNFEGEAIHERCINDFVKTEITFKFESVSIFKKIPERRDTSKKV